METISLKALAHKVLQRNRKGNSLEIVTNDNGNSMETGRQGSLFKELFNDLADKLSRKALTSDEIKAQMPELHEGIQAAIEEMDTAWLQCNEETFLRAVKTIEELYFKALGDITEWKTNEGGITNEEKKNR